MLNAKSVVTKIESVDPLNTSGNSVDLVTVYGDTTPYFVEITATQYHWQYTPSYDVTINDSPVELVDLPPAYLAHYFKELAQWLEDGCGQEC